MSRVKDSMAGGGGVLVYCHEDCPGQITILNPTRSLSFPLFLYALVGHLLVVAAACCGWLREAKHYCGCSSFVTVCVKQSYRCFSFDSCFNIIIIGSGQY